MTDTIFNIEIHIKDQNQKNMSLNLMSNIILKFITPDNTNMSKLVSITDKNLLFPIAMQLVHYDYDSGYKKREDIGRRVSILIVSNIEYIRNILENVTISTDYVIYSSIDKQNYFLNKRDNLMNDYYNSQSYWKDVILKKYRSDFPDYIPYKDIFPVEIGYDVFKVLSRNYFGIYDNVQQSVYYVTSNPNIFSKTDLPKFDYIIIDYSRITKFVRNIPLKVPVIYFFDSFLDDKIIYLKNGLNSIAVLDSSILKDVKDIDENYRPEYDEMIEKSKIENLQLELIPTAFNKSIEELIQTHQHLLYEKDLDYEKKIVSELIKLIILIPVSAAEYDTTAYKKPYSNTINYLLNELKTIEINNKLLINTRELMEDILYKYKLDSVSPKKNYIYKYIDYSINENKKILIVTGNEIANIALKISISQDLNIEIDKLPDKGIYIKTIKHVNELYSLLFDLVIITSCNWLNQISVITKMNYKKAILLLYEIEATNIKNKLEKLHITISENSNEINVILNEHNIEYKITDLKYLLNRFRKLKSNSEHSELINLDDIINNSEKRISKVKDREYTGEDAVEAILIEFVDESYSLFKKNGLVKILSPTKQDIDTIKVEKLTNDHFILFIDGQNHKDLYDELLKNLNNETEIKLKNFTVKQWREKLQDVILSKKDLNTHDIFLRMKKLGWKKSQQTIGNWISGVAMGPNNAEDIKLLGKVLGIPAFETGYDFYFNAMESLRILRRTVARRLNKAIFTANSKKNNIYEHEQSLEKYGLNFEDIQNAIEIKKIKNISKKVYSIKPSEIGIIFYLNREGK